MANHNPSHNNPPEILPVGNQTVLERELVQVEIFAFDADGDPLLFSVVNKPAGSHFQQNTTSQAFFSWTPTYNDAGLHEVTVRVQDEWSTDTETFYVEVIDLNRPPVMEAIRNRWVYELDTVEFTMNAHDPDGDKLNWSLESVPTADHNTTTLPAGLHFTPNNTNAFLAWTPDCTQGLPTSPADGGGAHYQFRANVTDGDLNASRQFNITVYHVDTPPELIPVSHHLGLEGTNLTFLIRATACDLEDHYLDVGLVQAIPTGPGHPPLPSPLPSTDLPLGVNVTTEDPDPMFYNATAGEYFSYFNWTILHRQSGNYTFYAHVRDAQNNTDNITFTIRIAANNTAPAFDMLPVLHNITIGTYWGKEDTRFNMTAPLGTFLGEGCAWDPLDPAPHALDGHTPCGTPFRASATDAENDYIFWNLEWISYNNVPMGGGILPARLALVAPGFNWTQGGGDPSQPTIPAAVANESGAIIRWIPTYHQAGKYQFRLSATDGLEKVSATFNISVENTNRRPDIRPVSDKVVHEGQELVLNLTGTDLDLKDKQCPVPLECGVLSPLRATSIEFLAGGPNTTGPSGLPAGLQWQAGRLIQDTTFNGAIRWNPGFHQAGVYNITLFANDEGDNRLFPANPLGYGNDISPGLILENPPVIPTPWTFPGFGNTPSQLQTEFYQLANFTITVLNVDRPPVLDPINDVSIPGGAAVYVPLYANDPDGDPITYNATGLPGFAALTDNGDGTAFIAGISDISDGGIYDVEVSACSGLGACDNQTFRIIVIVDTEYLIRPQAPVFTTVPGGTVTIPIRYENTGPANPDILNLELVLQNGLTGTIPATVLVASGESEWANATVTVPANVGSSIVGIRVTSTVDESYVKVAQVRIDVPISLDLTLSSTAPGQIQGLVNATFQDGTPVINTQIAVTQSPNTNPLGALSSTESGQTDAAGEFVFEFGLLDHPTASVPGSHNLEVVLTYGGKQYTLSSGYTI